MWVQTVEENTFKNEGLVILLHLVGDRDVENPYYIYQRCEISDEEYKVALY